MTRGELLSILHGPERAAEAVLAYKTRHDMLFAACQSMTANYDKVGGHGSGADSGDRMARLADERARLDAAWRELYRREAQVQDLLDTMKREHEEFSDRDYQLLRMRYVLRLPWKDVQEGLQLRGHKKVDPRTIRRWHQSAIASILRLTFTEEDIGL